MANQQTQQSVRERDEETVVVGASQMTEDQRQRMEMAEAAREKEYRLPSFGQKLFLGEFDASMVHPFPIQDPEDAKIGDEFIAKLKRLLVEMLDPEEVDATRTVPQDLIEEMAKLGVFAMKVPKEYGGLGFSQVNYNRVMQLVASYCGSTAVLISAHQSIGVPQPLKMYGTEAQKKQFLPRFREGAISAFALTEPDVGSDPAKMTTTAVPTPDGKAYVINGEKLWCTNGPIADVIVLMAVTPPKMVRGKERKQITAFIVEMKTPGIEVVHRCDFMGLRGIQNGLIRFKDVRVPTENIVWGEGRGLALALGTLNTGRLTLPAACSGLAKQCLNIARRWGNERVQWGQPIGYHEEGREKVAYIASATLAMDAVTWISSQWSDNEDRDIRIEAAMAKYFCTEMACQLADITLQLRGGRGYERASSLKARGETPFPVERMMRDNRINTIIEGTSEIMRLFLAREALDPHLKHLQKLMSQKGLGGKLQAVGGMLGFYLTWYPRQWFNGSLFSGYSEMGKLATHYRYIERTAHRLARTFFHGMAKHAQKLEKRQMLLARLIDIGTELFAMAATCSYAVMLDQKERTNGTAVELANHFCTLSRRRVNRLFKNIGNNDDKLNNKTAQATLEGRHSWLESNIIETPDFPK